MNKFEKRRAYKSLSNIITANFTAPIMLSLTFSRSDLSPDLAARRFTSWVSYWAKMAAGGKFSYLKLVEYKACTPIGFILITDLPIETCEQMRKTWSYGKTEVRALSPLEKNMLAQKVTAADTEVFHRRRWAVSQDIPSPHRKIASAIS